MLQDVGSGIAAAFLLPPPPLQPDPTSGHPVPDGLPVVAQLLEAPVELLDLLRGDCGGESEVRGHAGTHRERPVTAVRGQRNEHGNGSALAAAASPSLFYDV